MKILLLVVIAIGTFKLFFLYMEGKALYHPESKIPGTPASIGITYEEAGIKTSDGQSINGWYIPAKDAKITVLYCHGNAGNIYDRLHKAKFFHEMGVNFLIFDYRGYGKSSGNPSEKGLYIDAQAAYDYLVSRKDIDRNKIVVYGKSIGGPVAADLCLHREAKALILEGSFASVAFRAQQLYPFLPMKYLVAQKYDTVSKVRNIRIPKLIVHGRQDDVISFRHGEMLFSAAAEPKEFLPFDGGHNDDVYVTSLDYKKTLTDFISGQIE